MKKNTDYLKTIGTLIAKLETNGVETVLVGGMALVILGSQRVTNDFDFLVSLQNSTTEKIITVFYQHGFELVAKLNEQGEVIRTIANKKVAILRVKLDEPQSVYFYNRKTELKIDLLFDFPLPAKRILEHAHKIKLGSHFIRVACREDLLHLKEIAYKNRGAAADAQDLEFLRKKTIRGF